MIHVQKILLKDMMVKEPYTIGENEPFGLVWDIFRLHHIRHLPVLLNNRMIVGLVTLRDLYRTISPEKTPNGVLIYDLKDLNRFSLKDVMTKDVYTLLPEDTLGKAIDIMVKNSYGCIPIVDENRYLQGIVTRADILRTLSTFVV